MRRTIIYFSILNIALWVAFFAPFVTAPSSLEAAVPCDGLEDPAKRQCDEFNRLLAKEFEALDARGRGIAEEQARLDRDRESIFAGCSAAREAPLENTEGSVCQASGREQEALRTELELIRGERDSLLDEIGRVKRERLGQSWSSPNTEKDCAECPDLASVGLGAAIALGADHGNGQTASTALPTTTPLPSKPFMLAQTEVSIGSFRAYLRDKGLEGGFERVCIVRMGSATTREVLVKEPTVFAALGIDPPSNVDDHPAVCITRNDADEYAAWLTDKTNRRFRYRLPHEIEWEYAARPLTGNAPLPPTQDYSLCGFANIADSRFKSAFQSNALLKSIGIDDWRHFASCNDTGEFTESVQHRSASNPYGLINMLGNAAELTASCWSIAGTHANSNCDRLVIRGGSFASSASLSTLWARQSVAIARDGKQVGYFDVGFRVLREMAD